MACPDELTLDLWLADALPPAEAAAIAAHAAACPQCAAAQHAWHHTHAELRQALSLDTDERAYLSRLDLAAAWRAAPERVPVPWGWLAVASVFAAYLAWSLAGPGVQHLWTTLAQVGGTSLLTSAALGLLFSAARLLLTLAQLPGLSLSPLLLGLLAAALLAWPRTRIVTAV